MKNKITAVIIGLMLTISSAQAAIQMKVTAIEEFKTDAPTETLRVRVRENTVLGQYTIQSGDILNCKVLLVTDPKRGKQNANIYVEAVSYISSGKTTDINDEFVGKYSKTVLSKEEIMKMPKSGFIKKAALTVGSFYVKGLGPGVSLVEGITNDETGEPIRAGLKQVYKDSPLSYIEKGSELDLTVGDEFYLVFSHEEQEDKPNYTYTEPAK